jgi:hypothetical protein
VTLLERYRSGEHVQVYLELISSGARDEDAADVATELMRRVRHNLEMLADRWRAHDFALPQPLGDSEVARDEVARLERRVGRFVPTLRAFYDVIGWVDFIEEPPGSPWPETEQLDPIATMHPSDQNTLLDEETDAPEPAVVLDGPANVRKRKRPVHTMLPLVQDHLLKFGMGGVGAIYVPLPMRGFDAELWFQDERLRWPDGQALRDGHPFRLVPYLRETVLRRGGIGPCGWSCELDPRLVTELTEGLVPF